MHPIRRLLPSALALSALLACQPGGQPPNIAAPAPAAPAAPEAAADVGPGEPQLRTYTVPPEQSRALTRAIRGALAMGKETPPLGTVDDLPDGRILVVAPPGIQEGIAALLRDVDVNRAPPVRTAEFDYWVVVAEPAAAPEGVDAVPALAPALQAIVDSQGPMRFSLLESMRLSSLLDERAEANGNRMRVSRQQVTEAGGRLVAEFELTASLAAKGRTELFNCSVACNQFRTRVHLDPGQLLVVGQAGIEAEGKPGSAPKTMFYIVRGGLRSGGA